MDKKINVFRSANYRALRIGSKQVFEKYKEGDGKDQMIHLNIYKFK